MPGESVQIERERVIHHVLKSEPTLTIEELHPVREVTGLKQRWWRVTFSDSSFKWYKVEERAVTVGVGPP